MASTANEITLRMEFVVAGNAWDRTTLHSTESAARKQAKHFIATARRAVIMRGRTIVETLKG